MLLNYIDDDDATTGFNFDAKTTTIKYNVFLWQCDELHLVYLSSKTKLNMHKCTESYLYIFSRYLTFNFGKNNNNNNIALQTKV